MITMEEKIRIRPLTLADIDTVAILKKDVMRIPGMDAANGKALYKWMLESNPCRKDNYPIGFVLESDTGIEGAVALMPALCNIGAQHYYACFEVDLMVSERLRFHGLKLVARVWHSDIFPIAFSTTPNETSFNIEKRLGAQAVPFSSSKYVLWIDPIKVGIKKYGSKTAGIIFGVLCACFSAAVRIFSMMPKLSSEKISVEKIDRFDPGFDTFCEKASLDYSVIITRNSRYLNWRYVDFPYGRRTIVKALDGGGNLRGYMVLQDEKARSGIRVSNILEVFTRRADRPAMRALINAAIDHAKKNQIERLEHIPVGYHVESILSAMGFIKRRLPLPSCLYKMGSAVSAKDTIDMSSWFISAGEGDTSLYSAFLPV
jgi:hypothetical protein